MGEIEDILTVATLVLDRHADPERYIQARLTAAGDAQVERKWQRVLDAVRAMLNERRARGPLSAGPPH